MNVYIISDMEGISGIWREEMVNPGHAEHYAVGRKLLMADLNAAIAACFEAGANRVVVNDGHGGAPHILLEEMDQRAEYERPQSGANVFPSLDDSFTAMVMIGAHAMAGTPQAFLDHTQSSTSWYNYFVNGRKYGEIGQMAILAGHWDVPLVAVSGDDAACQEAKELLGEAVATAVVKWAIGRQWARCLHPVVARERIRQAVLSGLALVGKAGPYKIGLPATVRVEFYRTDMADPYEHHPRVKRVGPREIELVVERACDILNFA